jgi:hypothetical protein
MNDVIPEEERIPSRGFGFDRELDGVGRFGERWDVDGEAHDRSLHPAPRWFS